LSNEVTKGGQPAVSAPLPPGATSERFVFTGSGSEYFRIWVVNVLLTVLTLGVYSAWAKVRKARYFWQNTRLGGHVFDYHGRPVAILRGRIIALVLLAGYTWAFEFSNTAGIVTFVVLCVVGPWLFMRAQQFKLGNTSYRGLRFGFESHPREAYRIVLPILVLWLLPTIIATLTTDETWWGLLASALISMLAVPWMHHRLKAYQHRRACYGDRTFSFVPIRGKFYATYAKGLALVVLGAMAGGFVVTFLNYALRDAYSLLEGLTVEAWLYGIAAGLGVYLLAWPYLAARLQQAVWASTRLREVSFRTRIEASRLSGLVLKNVTLIVLTAGLYWPFAAIALARYRIECMRIYSGVPLGVITAGLHSMPVGAAGEGALDSFGIDLGV